MKNNKLILFIFFPILVSILYCDLKGNDELDIINSSIYNTENILAIEILDQNEKFVFSESKVQPNGYFILRKFNAKDEILFKKKFYLEGNIKMTAQKIFTMEKISDGYLIYGQRNHKKSFHTNRTAWIKVIDKDGLLKWENNNINNYDNYLADVVEINDNSLILGLQIYTDHKQYSSIMKFDNFGRLLWEKKLDNYKYNLINNIEYTKDQKIIVGGLVEVKEKLTNKFSDFWLVQLGLKGNVEWEKNFGGDNVDYPAEVKVIGRDEYLLAGTTLVVNPDDNSTENNKKQNIWISKINSKGNILWEEKIDEFDNEFIELYVINNNSFIVIYKKEEKSNTDYSLLKLNKNGKIIKNKLLKNVKTQEENIIYDFYKVNNNYFLTGIEYTEPYVNLWNEKNTHDWIMKLNNSFNIKWKEEIPKYVN